MGRHDLAARAPRPVTARPFAHSTYTLSPEQLVEIAAPGEGVRGAAAPPRRRERDRGRHRRGASRQASRGTPRLARPARPRLLLAHAVDLTGPEIAALARTGTSVAHCPVSNLKLGCGIAPFPGCSARV